jgi:hypothetical protein
MQMSEPRQSKYSAPHIAQKCPGSCIIDPPPSLVGAGFRQRSMKAQGVGAVCPPVAHDDTMEPISRAAMIKAVYVLTSLIYSGLYSWPLLLRQPPLQCFLRQ